MAQKAENLTFPGAAGHSLGAGLNPLGGLDPPPPAIKGGGNSPWARSLHRTLGTPHNSPWGPPPQPPAQLHTRPIFAWAKHQAVKIFSRIGGEFVKRNLLRVRGTTFWVNPDAYLKDGQLLTSDPTEKGLRKEIPMRIQARDP